MCSESSQKVVIGNQKTGKLLLFFRAFIVILRAAVALNSIVVIALAFEARLSPATIGIATFSIAAAAVFRKVVFTANRVDLSSDSQSRKSNSAELLKEVNLLMLFTMLPWVVFVDLTRGPPEAFRLGLIMVCAAFGCIYAALLLVSGFAIYQFNKRKPAK